MANIQSYAHEYSAICFDDDNKSSEVALVSYHILRMRGVQIS